MQVTFLGTGTSNGVPVIGCNCKVCTSSDPHDKRLRSSILITLNTRENGVHNPQATPSCGAYKQDEDTVTTPQDTFPTRILIDCGPDFRQQMLKQPYGPINALLVTHEHYDHVGGIDDFRPFCVFNTINIYGEKLVIKHLRERLPYCFGPSKYPSAPRLELNEIKAYEPVIVNGIEVMPLRVMHGKLPIIGFKIGRFAYITDMSQMPQETFELLQGLDTLIINALRITPHPTHQSISQAVDLIGRLRPRQAYLTHMAHSVGLHADYANTLPPNISLAYDGLEINVPDDAM